MEIELENLDAFMDADDLISHLMSIDKIISALTKYKMYGYAKVNAMENRIKGNILIANGQEQQCDMLYRELPESVKVW